MTGGFREAGKFRDDHLRRKDINAANTKVEPTGKSVRFSIRGIGEPESPTSMPVGKISRMEFLSDIGVSCSKNAEHPFL